MAATDHDPAPDTAAEAAAVLRRLLAAVESGDIAVRPGRALLRSGVWKALPPR